MRDYERVAQAIRYLETHFRAQPTLAQAARAAGTSPWHFQRMFRRWAGVSPKRFVQFLTLEYVQEALERGRSALAAAYDAGLSSPSRLHDLFVAVDAITPGEFTARGNGLTIRFGTQRSPFGGCFIALTHRGVCALEFLDRRADAAIERLRRRWPEAQLVHDQRAVAELGRRIFRAGVERPPLHVRGTNFQLKVWEALLAVPPGACVSYGDLARTLGRPGAGRAVGRAVADNPVAYLIPCHRVIRSSGLVGAYRWGAERKRALLAWDGARHAEDSGPDPREAAGRRGGG